MKEPKTPTEAGPSRRPARSRPSRLDRLPPLLGSHTSPVSADSLGPPPPGHSKAVTDNSVIYDVGDTKQLESTATPSRELSARDEFPATVERTLTGIGGSFTETPEISDSELGAAASLSDDDDEGCDDSDGEKGSAAGDKQRQRKFEYEIEENLERSMWTAEKKEFLPVNRIDAIITKETVRRELWALKRRPDKRRKQWARINVEELTQQIWGISSSFVTEGKLPEKTTRRKLFIILFRMAELDRILGLVKEGIHDNDLPFIAPHRKPLHREMPSVDGGGGPAAAGGAPPPLLRLVKSLESLAPHQRNIFDMFQWQVLAPFWKLSSKDAPKIHHYPLHDRIVLPFIENKSSGTANMHQQLEILHEGGYSEVHQVLIHEAHHSEFARCPDRKNPFFAVKKLKAGTTSAKFEEERRALIRSGLQEHKSLIRLLVTFEHAGRYHLVFPWADANLYCFWMDKYPGLTDPPRDLGLTLWLAREFSGLVDGLSCIHHSLIPKDNPQQLQPESRRIHGRHGDIKPQNILWFKGDGGDGDMGVLKIADFGFADFHGKDSTKVPASQTGNSPNYRAPEYDSVLVSQTSDMWSLGCVLLECVEWYCKGWAGVDAFSLVRSATDTSLPFPEDNFFVILKAPQRGDHRIKRAGTFHAKVKDCVVEEIEALKGHEKCSDFFLDVLDFIETRLLDVDPETRAKCDELVDTFQRLYQKCEQQPRYCTERTRPVEEATADDVVVELDPDEEEEEDDGVVEGGEGGHALREQPSIDSQLSGDSDATGVSRSDSVFSARPPPLTAETTREGDLSAGSSRNASQTSLKSFSSEPPRRRRPAGRPDPPVRSVDVPGGDQEREATGDYSVGGGQPVVRPPAHSVSASGGFPRQLKRKARDSSPPPPPPFALDGIKRQRHGTTW